MYISYTCITYNSYFQYASLMSMINIPLLYSNTFPCPISTNAFYLLNILPTVYLKIGEHIFCWHWDIPARAVDVQR